MSTKDFVIGRKTARPRAQTVTLNVPAATTGLLTTVSTFGLLAPVTFAKTSGSSNLTLNTSTGGISATAGISSGVTQSLVGTATGTDGVVIPFTANLTGTVIVTAPTAPTITLTAGDGQISVAWTDGSNGGATITSHKLYRSTSSGAEVLIATISTASPYVDTGLSNGTTYYYKLSAVNSAGESALSTEQSAAPAVSGGLSAPTLTRTSGVTAYPPTIDFTRPVDWQDGDTAVMQRSQDITFATGVTEVTQTMAGGTTSYNFGLSSVASGVWYFRMAAWHGTRPGSLTWSNTVGVGTATAPAMTSSASLSALRNNAKTFTLTTSIPSTLAITGGANQNDGTLSGMVLSVPAQSAAGTLDIRVTPTSIFGVVGAEQVITVTVGENNPSAFTFTDVSSATLNSTYTSNTITVAGLPGGTVSGISVSGGTYSLNGGAYTSAAGLVTNGDTVSVRGTAPNANNLQTNVVLTIGGVSDTYTIASPVTFSSTLRRSELMNWGYATSASLASAVTIASGDKVLVICTAHFAGPGTTLGVTANSGAITFTQIGSTSSGNARTYAFYADTAGVTSLTMNITSGTAVDKMVVEVVSLVGPRAGGPIASYFEQRAITNEATHDVDGSLTVPTNGGLICSVGMEYCNPVTWTGATEYAGSEFSGDTIGASLAYQLATGNITIGGQPVGGPQYGNLCIAVTTWGP